MKTKIEYQESLVISKTGLTAELAVELSRVHGEFCQGSPSPCLLCAAVCSI